MSRFGRHFVRTREIKAFERRLIGLLVDRPGVLHERHEALFRYALSLAQMNLFRTPHGDDVSVAEEVDPLRRWILESIVPLIPEEDDADVDMLREMAPILEIRMRDARDDLLDHHRNDFAADHLDAELREKVPVFVLGGGGGSGLTHLGTFSMAEELGIVPELVVGSSMGSVMATLRAIDRDYDPIATALSLPRQLDYNSIFRPFSGYSRYGFPGAFHLNLLRSARQIFQELVGSGMPRFSDLPIKLEIVACGIRTGFEIDEKPYEKVAREQPSTSPFAIRRRLKLFFNAMRELSRNPRFLSQVVFGREPGTRDFPVIEAVGFSCAVPGLLHYDIFHDDPETIGPLDEVFERNRLLRLCDGGVVNNVPSQVAWESVQSGSIGTRNAYIMSFDVFAPVTTGRNMLWIPIQQIARPMVLANRPYADFHKAFRNTPSPLQIIINSYTKLKSIIASGREQLEEDVAHIQKALEPIPRYEEWKAA